MSALSGYAPEYLVVINRETDEVEATLNFWPSEIEMPGYVENVENGYRDTRWRTERRTR